MADSADSAVPRAPQHLTERDIDIICGIIVSSQLSFDYKNTLCERLRAAASKASPQAREKWQFVPLEHGGYQLEHHTLTDDIEIEVRADGEIEALYWAKVRVAAPGRSTGATPVNKADRKKLAALWQRCLRHLSDPARQSDTIWRGDMLAIVAAVAELTRLERKIEKLAVAADLQEKS